MSKINTNKDTKLVKLSKKLSWLLRHHAIEEGIAIKPDGYVKISDILSHPKFSGYSISDVQTVVDSNEKQRFSIKEEDSILWICANQGHSMKNITPSNFKSITSSHDYPKVIHGTYKSKYDLIKKSGGLSRMNRSHIHFAKDLTNVISGIRADCNVFIYIDLDKALNDGFVFYESANGVILSPGNQDGILPLKYFQKVTVT